jgi:hypothetical protein
MRVCIALLAMTTGCQVVFDLDPIEAMPMCFGRQGELGAGLLEACLIKESVPDRPTFTDTIDTDHDCTSVVQQLNAHRKSASSPRRRSMCNFRPS